jgi:RNA polymerase sigma factor (sigma-70 family)
MSLRFKLPPRLIAPRPADDDRALLQRFLEANDNDAFAGLVDRHARMVLGVCKRTVRDAHLAEDAFQATFLVLARCPARAVAAASVGGWLFGIARRVGLAARRQELRRQRLVPTSPGEQPTAQNQFDEVLQLLDEELGAMPEKYRTPLVACFLEERTQDEAARQLGWSLSTLRRRLDAAKELLRLRLTRRGMTLAAGLLAGAVASSAKATVSAALFASAQPGHKHSAAVESLASPVLRSTMAAKLMVLAGCLAVAAGGVVIGGPLTVSSPPDPGPLETPAAQKLLVHAPVPRDPRVEWVTVSGRVVFPKDLIVPRPRPVFLNASSGKDWSFFSTAGALTYNDRLIDPKTRGIANVLVWLRPDSDDRLAVFPSEEIHPSFEKTKGAERVVETVAEGFQPRILGARAGDRLVFKNPSRIGFNVNYSHSPEDNDPDLGAFNILLRPDTTYTSEPLLPDRRLGVVHDSIHHWLDGYARVFEHPYFAVTDAEGRFRLENAPVGAWRVVIWHERAGYLGGSDGRLGKRITISPDRAGGLNLGSLVLESVHWMKPD